MSVKIRQKYAAGVAHRREIVTRLALRQLSTREIAEELAEHGITVSHVTVANDLQAIKAAWRESTAANWEEHRSRQMAEIGEGKRQAWADGDLQAHARYLKLEMDLLGTQAPPRAAVDEAGETVRPEPVMILGNVRMRDLWPGDE